MSIADKLQLLAAAKTAIAEAITAKGGTVNEGDGFGDFADDIATISGGGANLQSRKTVAIEHTGNTSIQPDSGYDGMREVQAVIQSSAVRAAVIQIGATILGVNGTLGFKSGTISNSTAITGNNNVNITTLSSIGFTPSIFILVNGTAQTTKGYVNASAYIKIGSSDYLRVTAIARDAGGAGGPGGGGGSTMEVKCITSDWSTSSSGYITLSSSNIIYPCSRDFMFSATTFTWYAIQ